MCVCVCVCQQKKYKTSEKTNFDKINNKKTTPILSNLNIYNGNGALISTTK